MVKMRSRTVAAETPTLTSIFPHLPEISDSARRSLETHRIRFYLKKQKEKRRR